MARNLISDLGQQYCSEFLGGALINHGGNIHIIQQVDDSWISTVRLDGSCEKLKLANSKIPFKALDEGFNSLEFPDLGYRSCSDGKVLMYLGRKFTTRRGLHARDLTVIHHPITNGLFNEGELDPNYYSQRELLGLAAMKPNYLTLADGLKQMEKGKLLSFCVSHEVAVAPAIKKSGYLDILFRGNVAGSIDKSGKVSVQLEGIDDYLEKLKDV